MTPKSSRPASPAISPRCAWPRPESLRAVRKWSACRLLRRRQLVALGLPAILLCAGGRAATGIPRRTPSNLAAVTARPVRVCQALENQRQVKEAKYAGTRTEYRSKRECRRDDGNSDKDDQSSSETLGHWFIFLDWLRDRSVTRRSSFASLVYHPSSSCSMTRKCASRASFASE